MYRDRPAAGELAPLDCADTTVESWADFDGAAAAGEIAHKTLTARMAKGVRRKIFIDVILPSTLSEDFYPENSRVTHLSIWGKAQQFWGGGCVSKGQSLGA